MKTKIDVGDLILKYTGPVQWMTYDPFETVPYNVGKGIDALRPYVQYCDIALVLAVQPAVVENVRMGYDDKFLVYTNTSKMGWVHNAGWCVIR